MEKIIALAESLLSTNWNVDNKIYNLKKSDWLFDFNNAKKSLGLCNFKNKTIYLSKDFVISNPDDFDVWNDTIRHEIAHAIDFEIRHRSDHSELWKNIGRQVGCETENHKVDTLTIPLSKYTLRCDSCGVESGAHRKKIHKVACATCCKKYNNGKFSISYVLTVTKNF